jgi:putative transposase
LPRVPESINLEACLPVKERCRKGGFSDTTFPLSMNARTVPRHGVPDAKRLRDLKEESAKLKKLLGEAPR